MTGFGTESWGTDSWGFGDEGSGGGGGGLPISIDDVTFIAQDFLQIKLSLPVRIDGFFTSTANYGIVVRPDTPIAGDPVTIVEILPPTGEVILTDIIHIRTSVHTIGSTYKISFGQLFDGDGVERVLSAAASYQARVTKSMLVAKSLPSHFDNRLTSLVRQVITAISLEDDRIGGSRDDEF